MQKLLLTIALVFALTATASASANFSLFFNDTRGMEETRKLASVLHFNESTFIQIKRLNDAKYKEFDHAAVKFNNNSTEKAKAIKEIEDSYAAKIKGLLTPIESVAYINYLNAANSRMAVSK